MQLLGVVNNLPLYRWPFPRSELGLVSGREKHLPLRLCIKGYDTFRRHAQPLASEMESVVKAGEGGKGERTESCSAAPVAVNLPAVGTRRQLLVIPLHSVDRQGLK